MQPVRGIREGLLLRLIACKWHAIDASRKRPIFAIRSEKRTQYESGLASRRFVSLLGNTKEVPLKSSYFVKTSPEGSKALLKGVSYRTWTFLSSYIPSSFSSYLHAYPYP
jgi:hypothetical protein